MKSQNSTVPAPHRLSILRNAGFGVVDYAVQPLLMLATARFFIRHLGTAQFGIWMLIVSVIGSSGSLCTGFGDAALKHISAMRGRADRDGLREVIRASITLNLALGCIAAAVLFVFAKWASVRAFHLAGSLGPQFVIALRIGTCILVFRSVAFVFISTLRAFEAYNIATRITSAGKLANVVVALLLTMRGWGVAAILTGTLGCEVVMFLVLLLESRRVAGDFTLAPRMSGPTWRALVSFGTFSWLQALSGTIFSQADRLLIAAFFGPSALAYYGVCVQASQPIHGLTASALNVLFPHLSARMEREAPAQVAATLSRAIRVNIICASLLSLPLIILSRPILNHWMGTEFSRNAATTLSVVAVSFALLAINIPGHYALMALGNVRYLTALNLVGGFVSVALAFLLLPHFGILGAAVGRLAYGPITWLMYPKLKKSLATTQPLIVVTESELSAAV
jgi:O-antigen/teichoic acid export membrane protein